MADAMGSVYRWQVAYVYGYMAVIGVLLWIWFAQGVFKDARCDIGGFSRFGGSGKGGSPGIYVEVFRIAVSVILLVAVCLLAASSAMPPTITDYVVMGALLAMAIVLFILRKYMEKGRGGIFFTGSERQRSSVSWTKYVIWYGMVCVSAAVFLLPRPVGWGYIVWLVPVMLLVVFMQYVFTKR